MNHERKTADGFLAIWSDVTPENELDYLHWLTREHTHERLGVTGFSMVRVYRLLRNDVRRYFIRYDLQNRDVLGSEPYLARLNAPTAWSQRIMPTLQNFARGGGHVRTRAGLGHGGLLAIVRFDTSLPAAASDLPEKATAMDGVVAAGLLQTDHSQTLIQTNEKDLRTGDQTFAGLLLIEGLREDSLVAAVAGLGLQAPDGIYAQVFQLRGAAG